MTATQTNSAASGSFFERRLLQPLRHLLLTGISPRRLAWSLAAGTLIGINPIFGSATVLTFAVAFVFRLNVVASQLANYLVYPLQVGLLVVFLQMGSRAFHTAPVPFNRNQLADLASHPVAATRMLWSWEWHAFVIWLALACVLTPVLAITLQPALRKLLHSLLQHRHDQ